jgi:hypothetical protein
MFFDALFPFLFIVFMVVVIPMVVMVVITMVSRSQQRKQREYWRSLPPPRERLPESPTCPRCRSGMVRGYLLDRAQGGFGMGMWLEGPPVRPGFTPRLERSIPIVSYRCTGCGYLELYARPELVEELDRGKPAGYPEL